MLSDNRLTGHSIRQNILKYAIYFGSFWYVLLATVNYLNQRPLWGDEEAVFSSIQVFSTRQMFHEHLLGHQVFPRLYLFLVKEFSQPFHFHVLSLRFLSFVCMMTAFGLWLRLAGYELKNKIDYLAFVLSWTASGMLIYYASELKQYSMDVLAGALYVWFIYNEEQLRKVHPKKYFLILMALPFLGLLSYPAFLFSMIVLYNLLASRRDLRSVGIYGMFLLAALGLAYCFDLRHNARDVYTEGILKDYFISFESVGAFFQTLGEGMTNLFSRWLVEQPRVIKKIGIFFMVFGLLKLFGGFFACIRKEKYLVKTVDTLAFVLFMALFGLGALKKYPFIVPRTVLFFCPFILLLTIKGLTSLKNINTYIYRFVYAAYFLFLVFLALGLTRLIFTKHSVFQPII